MLNNRFVATRSLLFSSVLLFSGTSGLQEVFAEEQSSTTHVVITANRYPTSIEEVGSSISVVDGEEIEKTRQTTVLEVLRTVPGLEVVQTGGPGRTASIFVRGAESDHTLVLVDGVRINDNTTGQFDFANLSAENIERIEVLRGPQSVLYGSEAIGGVINIITKRADRGLSGKVVAQGGSFGTQEYHSAIEWGSENFFSSTSLSYHRTDGISVAASDRGNPEDDSYDRFSFSTRNGLELEGGGEFNATFRYSMSETELDDFDFERGPVDALDFVQESDELTASLSFSQPLAEWLTASVELGFSDTDLKGTDSATEFNNYTIDSQSQTVLTQFDALFPWGGMLSLGHSYESRKGFNRGNFDEQRDVNSLFVQKQYAWIDRLFLTGGARYDHDSDFGEEVTFRATAAYLLNDTGMRLHASYGTGFKAPTFNELFFPNFGNPDLDAETSWGYDVGVEQSFFREKVTLDVTFFQNEIDDLITFDTETFLAENIEEADVLGIETTLSVVINSLLRAHTSYTYTDSENKTTGGILARRPRHRGALQIHGSPIPNLDVSCSFVLVNSRRDSDRSKMDNYELVNLALSYSVSEHLKPFVRIDNVFDEDYEEVTGFGTRGFSAYAGLEASL